MLTSLPRVSPKEGGRAARVLSLVATLPSARALLGVVCEALGAVRGLWQDCLLWKQEAGEAQSLW